MMQTFKIRCSSVGKIMGSVNKPTQNQMNTIAELEAKEKLTTRQQETLMSLVAKRDQKPELSAGAKTYCQNWIKEQLYGRRQEFSNKYTEKGNLCEPSAIELVAEVMGYGMVSKNEDFFENDFMLGTPDLILSDSVEDIKNSWSCFTFPLFETEVPNSDYFYQLQAYMALTGKSKAALNYCLIDAPEELIDREARFVSLKAGMSDVDMELYDEVYKKMTYSDISNDLKLKRFEFDRDDSVIDAINTQVVLCREYIKQISNAIK